MSPRVYSSARDRILDAAERVIRSKGVGQLTVESVAAEAKVSKGGFFHHFASKGDLLVAILDRLLGGVEEQIASKAAEDPERSEEHTSELQSLRHLVCRLLLEKKNKKKIYKDRL